MLLKFVVKILAKLIILNVIHINNFYEFTALIIGVCARTVLH